MLKRDQRGAAAVEFALVSLILFLVLFGIVQFGLAFNRSQGIHAAAREGARLAALPETTVAEIVTRVGDSASIIDKSLLGLGCPSDLNALALDAGCVRVQRRATSGTLTTITSTTAKPCDQQFGATVVVTVAYRTEIVIPLWGTKQLTLSGDGEFRCET